MRWTYRATRTARLQLESALLLAISPVDHLTLSPAIRLDGLMDWRWTGRLVGYRRRWSLVRRHCSSSVALRWTGLVAVIGYWGLGAVMRALVGRKGRCVVPV
jgi:hypothetical protein